MLNKCDNGEKYFRNNISSELRSFKSGNLLNFSLIVYNVY